MAEDLDKISEEEIAALAENNIPRDLLEEIAFPIPEIANHYSLRLKNEILIFCPDSQGNYRLWDNQSPFSVIV